MTGSIAVWCQMMNDEAKLAKEAATNSVMLQHVQSAYWLPFWRQASTVSFTAVCTPGPLNWRVFLINTFQSTHDNRVLSSDRNSSVWFDNIHTCIDVRLSSCSTFWMLQPIQSVWILKPTESSSMTRVQCPSQWRSRKIPYNLNTGCEQMYSAAFQHWWVVVAIIYSFDQNHSHCWLSWHIRRICAGLLVQNNKQ